MALLDKLKTEVDRNLQNVQFGVQELAESVGMSRSNLHRKLQAATGQSVSQFIREYRLDKALGILKTEEFTVAEVAYKVGFSSASYFSKRFSEYYGYPPVEVNNPSNLSPENAHVKKSKNRNYVVAGLLLVGLFVVFLLNTQTDETPERTTKNITIAVLPFKNMTSDKRDQYFSDGVMDAILNKLSKIKAMRVTSRRSVEQFRATTKTISEIANKLQVEYILEGSAQKYGEEIKVAAQLIDVEADAQVWSQEYIRTFKDILSLQGEIAQSVAKELTTSLSIEEQEELTGLPTTSAEAYNYLLKGNDQSVNRSTKKGIETAFTFYKKAIELDAKYLDAYVELANLWVVSGAAWGIKPQAAWDSAQVVLAKILELDPENSKAYHILAAGQYLYDWDFENAKNNFDKAQAYLLATEDHWDFDFYTKMGSFEKVLTLVESYIQQYPLISRNYYGKAQALYFLDRKNEAIRILDEVNSQFDDFLSKRECVKLYFLYGETQKFLNSYEKLLINFSDRPPLIIWFGAMRAITQGADPAPYIAQLEKMFENNLSGSPGWFIALTYAALKEEDRLFDWLEKSYERREVEMTWLKSELALTPFKNDPRYIDLMTRMNFPE